MSFLTFLILTSLCLRSVNGQDESYSEEGRKGIHDYAENDGEEKHIIQDPWADIKGHGDQGLGIDNYKGRPLPPELKEFFDDPNMERDELQDCMDDFVVCLQASVKEPLCASTHMYPPKIRKFGNICEMDYANCRRHLMFESRWHFVSEQFCANLEGLETWTTKYGTDEPVASDYVILIPQDTTPAKPENETTTPTEVEEITTPTDPNEITTSKHEEERTTPKNEEVTTTQKNEEEEATTPVNEDADKTTATNGTEHAGEETTTTKNETGEITTPKNEEEITTPKNEEGIISEPKQEEQGTVSKKRASLETMKFLRDKPFLII